MEYKGKRHLIKEMIKYKFDLSALQKLITEKVKQEKQLPPIFTKFKIESSNGRSN